MRKTQIGGQAVMEGVMMRGKCSMATAVRNSDGDIVVESKRLIPVEKKNVCYRIPVLRGIINFATMLYTGTQTLLRSSEVYGEEIEPSKFDKWLSEKLHIDIMKVVIWFSVLLGVACAVGLFVFLPQFLTELLFKVPALNALSGSVRDVVFSVIEGLIRLVIFVAYVAICSCVPDVKRVFMYHGAEHKTINAFEHDEELTVENVQKYSTIHKRCGTTFMVLVMVVSIIVLAFAGWLTVDVFGWPNNAGIKFAVRIVMIPLVAGISYEILKLLALSDNIVVRIIRWPGLQLQRLTTRQPDDDMVEVAIVAFKTVYEMDADETIPERTFDIGKPYKDAREQVEKILPADKFDKSDVDWIFTEVTGKNRSELPLLKTIKTSQFERALAYAKERATGKPLQYVFGHVDFYDAKLLVNENVLIPRPETELLAEAVANRAKDKSVLDLCTGSGAIAISVKKHEPTAAVTASDVSENAIFVAKANGVANLVDVKFITSDLFENIDGEFDIIVSNPPYIKADDIQNLDVEVRGYEPIIALDGGKDGLEFYRRIIDDAAAHLRDGGELLMELGIGEAEDVKAYADGKLEFSEFIKDYDGIDRIVVFKKR
ncbi:MAG: peptide chain release factor N(5)-glutamine methyltransferase [Clostridiales bacterium]|nr:peptide chain release factor N(5)-glutamine methyltransferase [Clostridiales bacterium]